MRQLRPKLAGPSSGRTRRTGRRAVSDDEGGAQCVAQCQCHVSVSTPSLLTCYFLYVADVVAVRERNDFLAIAQSMSPVTDTSDLCQKSHAGPSWQQTVLKNDSVISVAENENSQVATVTEESPDWTRAAANTVT